MKWIKRAFRRFFRLGVFLGLLLIGLIWFANHHIVKKSEPFVFDNPSEFPKTKVGLVLGTSKKVVGGQINLYFKYRMEAAAELFEAGKIDYILVSGDNSDKYYNETQDMKEYLMELGVPEDKIKEDFAGLRTLDSVLRASEVFGVNQYVVISQGWHAERAVFIARQHGIHALGYAAKDVGKRYGLKTKIREYLTRVLALLDVYVLNTRPKYYQEKHLVFEE